MTPDDGNGDGGFLGRWARRKQEAQRARPPETQTPAAPEPAPHTLVESPPAELPLPSLDSIVPGADVSAFFQGHVPEALRKAALRKLWTTDPEISGFIEMADYQWDFSNPDAIPGWGSTLPEADISRLASRFFGEEAGSPPRDKEPKAVSAEPSPPQISGGEQLASDDAAAAPDLHEPVGATEGTDNVAPQKTPEETVIYSAARKRHGGALPT